MTQIDDTMNWSDSFDDIESDFWDDHNAQMERWEERQLDYAREIERGCSRWNQ
jgi:hypothetical protein